MPTVAICYSGQPRSIEKSWEQHLNVFSRLFRGWIVEFYFHTWKSSKDQPYFDPLFPKRGSWCMDYFSYISKFNPVKVVIEAPMVFLTSLKPDFRFPHPIQHTMSMFYGMDSVFGMISDSVSCVVRMRTDNALIGIPNTIDQYDLTQINVKHEPNKHVSFAINDQFAFGSYNAMKPYMKVFSSMESLVKSGYPVNPECLCGGSVQRENISVAEHLDWKHCLWRDYRG